MSPMSSRTPSADLAATSHAAIPAEAPTASQTASRVIAIIEHQTTAQDAEQQRRARERTEALALAQHLARHLNALPDREIPLRSPGRRPVTRALSVGGIQCWFLRSTTAETNNDPMTADRPALVHGGPEAEEEAQVVIDRAGQLWQLSGRPVPWARHRAVPWNPLRVDHLHPSAVLSQLRSCLLQFDRGAHDHHASPHHVPSVSR